ncbi:MAG: DUF4920 domain-containing protein [Roseivirga sp.]|nr:DUF4920 domain-containing protein [Roseivirga sp.]
MMKKLLLFALLGLFVACSGPANDSKNSLANAKLIGNYGETIDAKGAISPREMMSQLAKADTINVKVQAEITATCAMKGCWMNLKLEDGEEMRVTFKDYAFFVPKEGMEGNKAVIEGVVSRTMTDVATLKHFAEDAGKPQIEIDAITEPKKEYTFEASGVIIYAETE